MSWRARPSFDRHVSACRPHISRAPSRAPWRCKIAHRCCFSTSCLQKALCRRKNTRFAKKMHMGCHSSSETRSIWAVATILASSVSGVCYLPVSMEMSVRLAHEPRSFAPHSEFMDFFYTSYPKLPFHLRSGVPCSSHSVYLSWVVSVSPKGLGEEQALLRTQPPRVSQESSSWPYLWRARSVAVGRSCLADLRWVKHQK